MQTFGTLVRFPEAAHAAPTPVGPAQLIKDAIQEEGGKVGQVLGWHGRYDAIVTYECDSPEVATRIMARLKLLGFSTENGPAIDSATLDKAWQHAVKSVSELVGTTPPAARR